MFLKNVRGESFSSTITRNLLKKRIQEDDNKRIIRFYFFLALQRVFGRSREPLREV